MGSTITKLSQQFCVKIQYFKVLILGLEGAGKTTVFDRIRSNDLNYTSPTIGFNVEQVKLENFVLNLWDFGGHEKIMCLWERYFDNVDLIILVLDSTDNQNVDKVKEMFNIIKNKSKDTYVLILGNKIDLKDQSMSTDEMAKLFDIYEYDLKIVNFIPCSAVTSKGMSDMKKSIVTAIRNLNKNNI